MNCNSEKRSIVSAIQKFCLDDGPGIRTTVFLKGCPLRCIWCHNPETHLLQKECFQRLDKCTACGRCVPVCPADARSIQDGKLLFDREACIACGKCAQACLTDACEVCGKEMTAAEIIDSVARDAAFYKTSGGGMTVSGGECAANPDFTLELIRLAALRGIQSAIETSGYGKKEFFLAAAEMGTLFLYDLKEMDPVKHKQLTGVDNARILENLQALMDVGARIIIRMPLIPGANDADEDLHALASYLDQHRGKYEHAQIMPYHSLGVGKANALGRESFSVDPALASNECAACKARWRAAFAAHNVDVELA